MPYLGGPVESEQALSQALDNGQSKSRKIKIMGVGAHHDYK